MSRQIPTLTTKTKPQVGLVSNIPRLATAPPRHIQRPKSIPSIQSKKAHAVAAMASTSKRDIEPRTSFLSPKAVWSPERGSLRQVPRYQLSDPGPVNSRLPVTKRRVVSSVVGTTLPLNTPRNKSARLSIAQSSEDTITSSAESKIPRPISTINVLSSSNIPTRVRRSMGDGASVGSSIKPPQHAQQSVASRTPKPCATGSKVPKTAIRNDRYSATGLPSIQIPPASYVVNQVNKMLATGTEDDVDAEMAQDQDINVSEESMVDIHKTPVMSTRQTSSSSSIYSSASSLARSRAIRQSQAPNLSRPSSTRTPSLTSINSSLSTQSITTNATQPMCAPYLVPDAQENVTLSWEPDVESGFDEAEEIWRRMEVLMGKGGVGRGSSIRKRGRWVVKSNLQGEAICEREADGCMGREMERDSSGFSLSAYYDDSQYPMLLDGRRGCKGDGDTGSQDMESVLFDMRGPLIPSVSSSAATPANTPCFGRGSLKRVDRVNPARQSRSRDDYGVVESRSGQEYGFDGEAMVGSGLRGGKARLAEGASGVLVAKTSTDTTSPPRMYRLDSHIISALAAFQDQDGQTTPALDYALSFSSSPPSSSGLVSPSGGLGLGMHIRIDSIYGLGDYRDTLKPHKQDKGKGKDWWIRDLDTGEVTDVFSS